MYFELPMKLIGSIDCRLLDYANSKMIEFEQSNKYIFKYQNWHRLDSYNNPNSVQLNDIIGNDFIDAVMSYFPGQMLYGWSLSHLPAKTKILDHVDRMLLHRLAQRIVVPVTNTPDVLNWHYSNDKITKRFYMFEYGHIYRLNTSMTHGLSNNNSQPRRAVYFDVMSTRLYEKFKDNYEIEKVILFNSSTEHGALHVL